MKHFLKALLLSLLLLSLTGCIYDPYMYRQGGYHDDGYRPRDHERHYRRDGSRDNYHRRHW